MPPRARRDPGAAASRRVWIPLLAVAMVIVPAIWRMRNLPEPPASSEPSASAPASAAPAPSASAHVHPTMAARTISRAGGACQEWKRGSPPRFVRCPASLADGDVLEFLDDATCRRVGASPAVVPCPMEVELTLPASASAPVALHPPPPPERADKPAAPAPGSTVHGR